MDATALRLWQGSTESAGLRTGSAHRTWCRTSRFHRTHFYNPCSSCSHPRSRMRFLTRQRRASVTSWQALPEHSTAAEWHLRHIWCPNWLYWTLRVEAFADTRPAWKRTVGKLRLSARLRTGNSNSPKGATEPTTKDCVAVG